MPVTLTHDDGSEADARTAATHCAVRAVISSPRRTITLPRGIRVKTLSTPADAAARRSDVSVASYTRLGRSVAARNAAISVRSRVVSALSARRDETAVRVSLPY